MSGVAQPAGHGGPGRSGGPGAPGGRGGAGGPGGPGRHPGATVSEAAAGLRAAAADRPLLRRVVALFRPYRRRVLAVAGLILVTAGLGVANPLLIREIFDRALFVSGGPDVPLLLVLSAIMIAVPAVSSVLGVVQSYQTTYVGQQIMRDLRGQLFSHLQSLSLRFFTGTRTGEIQSRLQNDVGGLQTVITDTASSLLSNSVILISTLIAMFLLSWQLTLLSLVMLPLFVWLTGRVGQVRRRITSRTQAALAEMSAITQESLSVSGVLLSKVFGRQDRDAERYHRQNEELAALQVRQQIVGRAFFAVVSTFFSITPVLVYLVAGLQLSHGGGPSAGTIIAFTTLQSRLFMPIGQVLQTSTEVSSSLALFSRVFGYLDLRAEIVEPDRPVRLEPGQVGGEVRLEDVWFSYGPGEGQADSPVDDEEPAPGPAADTMFPISRSTVPNSAEEADTSGSRRWALRGLDLTVRPGQLAAVVGASGAGKTTLSYLIPRLYDVTSGAVRLDGHDVRSLSLDSLAGAIGMVTQETYLFHATVRDNLAYARPEATDEEVVAAARAAYIHDRILELENGYDTVVGERGYRLSGGEKQRLAIARVLLKDPRLLLLDEATSALDTVSERRVQAALEPLMAGRTTIAIAHRLSTIRSADVIFVMDAGRVVETGTHDSLLALNGAYAALYEQQYGGGLVEARTADGFQLTDGRVLETEG
ncbi:ABC transporter ATP-binding protein [Kineosporia sp. J2-2]|uniref:ABC transporter ATP-binding protein n=1 Tax=Kineosporia corallincola TaxID=2835133 RepID=A0ABS5T8L0_9ACTN|nr:ABC transporter ATP-binding protein [Kineosporia corallincola]MBT0767397.1 ABC transporter ATP-binding protein [Kineosporia corallincola]